MGTENQSSKGAPGQPEPTTPATPAEPPKATTPETLPKFEFKEGVVLVDGRKYVKESDLIAAKESLTKRLDEAQAVHTEAVDKLSLDLSAAQTEVAKANAKVQEAEQARKSGAISTEELAKVKQEAEAAKTAASTASVRILQLRREKIIIQSAGTITEDMLKDKTEQQLDSFEEALKVVAQSRGGPGNYAVGGGGGSATPATPMDRARALINSTPYRGIRNEPPNQAK